MFWQKLHHHLLFFFLAFVLLAQSLVFVVSQAVPFKNYELKSSWISPTNGQTIVSGQSVDLRASLDTKNKKVGIVNFVLSDPNNNFVVNFEAQKGDDNNYTSLAAWNTADWPVGVYNISSRATIIDDSGRIVDEQESAPIWVKVISIEEYDKLALNKAPSEIVDAVSNVFGTEGNSVLDNALLLDNTQDHTPTTTNNNLTTSTATSTEDLELHFLEANRFITERNFYVEFVTNFLADSATIEFINTDNAAISTGALPIFKTDGILWGKNIELDDSVINGSYKLLISVPVPGKNILVREFDYNLNIPTKIKPEDLVMSLVNLQSNVQGQIGLRANVNLSIDNLDFVIEDNINHVEALRVKGLRDSSASSSSVSFLAIFDTAVLPNGNYSVYVESKIDQQKVGSVKQLVTIYNIKNDNQATSTAAEGGLPESSATTTTSTVSGINNLAPDAESSIDCQRSGITDPILCQRYQAELSSSLPGICIEKNIFNGDACEKYIFENQGNVCMDNKITEATKCLDYLYQKYKVELQCNITPTSTCAQVISGKYIARLAYLAEEKNKYLAVINGLDTNGLTVNILNKKLQEAQLASSSLSLMLSDEKIDILKIKNNNLLDGGGDLFLASPVAIMKDSDGDMLPDDLEEYYGTNPDNVDSDNDGHSDGEEVSNNYNPLGEGKLIFERIIIDKLLFSKQQIEEPRTSVLPVDNNWQVKETNTVSGAMKISGKALANTWVNIFVYSAIPLLATSKTDDSGNWSYTITGQLVEGLHQVYVTSNDKDGKLLARSEPLTFLVANIKNDLAPVGVGQQVSVISEKSTTSNQNVYYIIGGVFLLLVLVGVVLLIIKRRRSRPDNLVLQAQDIPVTPSPVTINTTKEIKLNLPDTAVQPAVEQPPMIVENNDKENRPST